MAVLGRLLISSAERLDLPDFLSVDSYTQGDFKYLMKSFVGSDRPYVLTGFDIINPGAAIGTQNVAIRVADSVVYFPQSLAGPFFHGLEEGNTLSAPLVPELRKNSTNYVYLTLTTTEAAKDTRAFWDPDKEGGDGGEFTQDINTQSALVAAINVSTSSFPEDTVPVAIVAVGPNFITSIEDARDMMFRLGTGGLSPDPLSSYAFREDPTATNARLEPNTLMTNALDANAFQGGDKNIQSLKEWMDVVMTKLKEFGGTTYWYEDTSTFNLVNLFKDSLATSIKSKGVWQSSDGTPGLLTWTEDILVQSVSDNKDRIVRDGNKTLLDNQTMYIPLTRRQDINTGAVSVNWLNGLNYVNGTLGSFENLSKGDWIKKSDDPDYRYLRVEEFYAAANLAGGVTAPGNALSIKLSDVYSGISELKRAVYDKGVYLSSDVLVADRDDSVLSDIGGDLYWLALRSDTIMSASDFTTTTLSIDITNHDGLTAKCTSVAHGLTDGQRVGISGTTNFDGTYAVEVEDADTFYINIVGGPFANELTQSAHYATVTTQARSTVDGLQLESANHKFSLDQTIQVSDTTNYNGTYKIFSTGNTTFTIPVTTTIANETSGTATAVTVYVRTDIGPTKLDQGENKQIGETESENIMSFIGMDNASQTFPSYHIPPDYNTLDGQQNYNGEVTDNLTQRVSKLTAMMADKTQDKTVVLAPSGYTTVTNVLNGTARDISFNPAPSETPRLDIILPSSDQNNSIILNGTISLEANQAAYVQIDRNDPLNYANLTFVTVANITSIPLEENVYILAVRLGTDEVWLWDGFYVSGGITPIPSFIAQIVVQDRNAKLIEGGTWSWDVVAASSGAIAESLSAPNTILQYTPSPTQQNGQVFTATSTGPLSSIDLNLHYSPVPITGDIALEIYNTIAGVPTGAAIATSDDFDVSTLTNTATSRNITFTGGPVLTSGQAYAFILRSGTSAPTGSIVTGLSTVNPYAGGVRYAYNGVTFTAVPSQDITPFSINFSVVAQDDLTLSADAYIQIADLTKERNTILAQTIVLANDDEVATVEVVRSAGAATNLTVTVADETSVAATLNTFVIARRVNGAIILGTGTEQLLNGQSQQLDQTSSDQTLAYTGATDTADSDPNYTGPNRVLTQSQDLTAGLSSVDTEIDKFFGQMKMTADGTGDRVIMTGADRTMLDTGIIGQELASLLLKFEGAQIDFGTGEIFESDGTTPLGQDFTPVTIAANQWRWYSVSMIPNALDADGRITAQLLVLPGDADGATAALAKRAVFGGTKKIGQVVVQDNGAGGSGTVNNITQADIIQLGVGAGGGGASAPKMIGGGTFSWDQASTSLSFNSDIFIEQPRLNYADNIIDQATVSPIVLPTANHVAFIERLNASSGGPNLTVNVDLITNVKDGQIIIARRDDVDTTSSVALQGLNELNTTLFSAASGLLDRRAQQFTAGVTDNITTVRLMLNQSITVTGGTLRVEIQGDNGFDEPDGVVAAFVDIDPTTLPITPDSTFQDYALDVPVAVTAASQYFIVFRLTSVLPAGTISFERTGTAPITDVWQFSSDGGSTWGGPNLTLDAAFEVLSGTLTTNVIVGSTSTRLLDGESKKLFTGVSDQILNVIPATDNADDSGQARLKAQATPSTIVDVTSVTKTVPDGTEYGIQLKNLLLDFTGATIDFATGTVSTGINFTPVTIASNQYRWHSVTLLPGTVGIDGKIAGQLLILPASADGATAAAAIRAPWANGIPLGQVVVQDDGAGGAGTVLDINQSDIVQLSTSGGAGGEGNADEIIEALRNQLDLNNFRYVGYNVFRIDEDDKVDVASTGLYDIANGVYDIDTAENMISIQMLDEMFLTPSAFPETADEDVVDVPEVELTVFWDDSLTDDAAVYEVSRDAGNEYQVIDMTRVGTTNAYRGKLTFEDEAAAQILDSYTTGTLAVTDFEGLAANANISNATAFTLTDTAVINNFKFHYDKLGNPAGKFKVSIIRDDTALPSTDAADILAESTLQDIVSLTSGSNVVNVEIPSTALESGTYHVVISTDAAYKASYSNGVDELRVEVDSAGGSIDLSQLDGTTGTWIPLAGVSMMFELEGRVLDLRVKITASQESSLAGYGIFYNGTSGLVTGILNKEVFSFDGIADNDNEFTLTKFLPDPDLLRIYEIETGQVYVYGTFILDGHKVTFPADTFNKVGTVTLLFDQMHGTSFDNNDKNASLMAANHLGSTDTSIDRSVAGRGIILRRPDGTLRELTINDADGIDILSVP